MAADIEFPLTGEHLRKRALQLRAYIDQAGADPDFQLDDEESILERVFTQEELDWLEENEDKFFLALQRIDDDFTKVEDASTALHISQDALEAHATVIEVAGAQAELDADEDEDAGDEDAAADDPDGDVEEED